jgi:hypothetical protein
VAPYDKAAPMPFLAFCMSEEASLVVPSGASRS